MGIIFKTVDRSNRNIKKNDIYRYLNSRIGHLHIILKVTRLNSIQTARIITISDVYTKNTFYKELIGEIFSIVTF